MVSNRRHAKLLRREARLGKFERTTRFKPFPLLKLPLEIREMILRELLWHPKPLFFERPRPKLPLLTPNILRTCRQLYDEGQPILCANTIKYRIGNYGYPPYMEQDTPELLSSCYNDAFRPALPDMDLSETTRNNSWAQPSYNLSAVASYECLPPGLRHKVHKLDVDIVLDTTYFNFRQDDPDAIPTNIQHCVYRLAKFLDAHKQYTTLSFNLVLLNNHNVIDLDWSTMTDSVDETHQLFGDEVLRCTFLRSKILQPFADLRGRSSVSVTGVDPSLEKRMRLITTREPVLNLHAMLEALSIGFIKLFGDSDNSELTVMEFMEDILDDCQTMAEAGDEEGFLKRREQLMSTIATVQLVYMRRMLATGGVAVPAQFREPFLQLGPETKSIRSFLRTPEMDGEIRALIAEFESEAQDYHQSPSLSVDGTFPRHTATAAATSSTPLPSSIFVSRTSRIGISASLLTM
jgi:hypothetical protein